MAGGGVGQFEHDNAQLEVARQLLRLDHAKAVLELESSRAEELAIKCPFDGVLLTLYVEEGQAVQGPTPYTAGSVLAEVADASEYQIEYELTDYEASGVREGDKADIWFDAIPGLKVVGRVSSVAFSGRAVYQATSFPVCVSFCTPSPDIKLGMYGTVTINGSQPREVCAIPISCLYYKGTSIYVTTEIGGSLEEREIRAGVSDNEYVEVVEGLRQGDYVCRDGFAASRRVGGAK